MKSLVSFCFFAAACGSATPAPSPSSTSALLATRTYDVHVPPSYSAAHPTALVIVLHGYMDDGKKQDAYFRMSEVGDREGFLVARPDGTKDAAGFRFWNATDACCDFAGTHVDDVAFIGAVIDDVSSKYSVDPKRVFLVGHSNGAFFANRLACDLAPKVAAFATLAGVGWLDAAQCKAAAKVSLLAIHGDADSFVHYDGGAYDDATLAELAAMLHVKLPSPLPPGPRAYPSARASAATWATIDGCTGDLAKTGQLDLDPDLAGEETEQQSYGGCTGAAVELWTIHGGEHMPQFAPAPAAPTFANAVWAFFKAHPKA